jgi:predicted regulator of Ras-like GTPase activity (Roadblock/LC7/MglB family)
VNAEVYAIALKSALTEIGNICPDVSKSFILTNDGTLIAGDEQTIDPSTEKAVSSLQELTERTASIGGLDDLFIEGENGRVYVSRINNIYFITAMSKKTDLSHLRTITGVILPTIIKVLDNIPTEAAPPPTSLKSVPSFPSAQLSTPLKSVPSEPTMEEEAFEETEEPAEKIEEPVEPVNPQAQEALETETAEEEGEPEAPKRQITNVPSQQFIVDKFGGFMVRSDTVLLDPEVLQRWSAILDGEEISEVDVETFSGKTARCKTKMINDQKLEGRGLIRVPEKLCSSLELKKGELVRVKPVVTSESE